MNLRDLRYLCAVADHRHFGRAAESCHVSQPTLSGQIRKLEDYLGVELFERSTRNVRLTEIGAEIVAHARRVLQEADEIERIARARHDPESGPLRVGLIPTIAPSLLPLILPAVRERFPRLQPRFVEDVTDQLLRRLQDGALDAIVIATDPPSPSLRALPLYREPFLLALPRGHRLASQKKVSIAELEPEHLLLLTDGHCLRDQALEVCAVAVPSAQVDTTATSLETLVNLVGAGNGVTLVPELAARPGWREDPGIACAEVDDPNAARIVRLCYRAGYPRATLLEAVADTIRGVMPDRVEVLH